MGKRFWMILAAAAVALALPAAAPAQVAFDGTYAGVSATFGGSMGGGGRGGGCPQSFVPAPLTISGGHATSRWNGQPVEGSVSPQGGIVMHGTSTGRFEAQIDAQGTVKGGYSGACYYNIVWQKRR